MGLDRAKVRAVTEAVNKAVEATVKAMGFTSKTCRVSFSSYDGTINYKAVLIMGGMESKVLNANAVGGWVVGDKAKDRMGKEWMIKGFTTKGSLLIANENEKTYRCKLAYLLPKEA